MVLRIAAALGFIAILVGVSSCRVPGGTAAGTPQPTASSKASPSPAGPLDAQVPLPAGFPTDVPVYTGARLTAGAAFTSDGQTTWGMEWETLDAVDKVQAYYASKLSQGDWTTQISGVANGSFSATFSRKSNSKFGGILGADGSSGVTKISMSLASA